MNVLKGIFLVIWSLVGLLFLIMLIAMTTFVMSGGPQKALGALNPAQLLGGGDGGNGQQMMPPGKQKQEFQGEGNQQQPLQQSSSKQSGPRALQSPTGSATGTGSAAPVQ